MNKKLIFRILGAVSSSLIIMSVFFPFISVLGYSQSLWQSHQVTGTLYLPIMIIIFGLIGVIFFSLNVKTEFAYSTAGALLFFLIMRVVPVINEGSFNTLGMGFYCLTIGTVFTALMAFLCNLRTKIKVSEQTIVDDFKNESVLSQIDRLYDNQNNSMPININNDIQQIQNQEVIFNEPVEAIQPLDISSGLVEQNIVDDSVQIQNEQIVSLTPLETEVFENQVSSMNYQNVEQVMQPISFQREVFENQVKPINYQNVEQPTNMNTLNTMPKMNPVIQEFNTQNIVQPIMNGSEENIVNDINAAQAAQLSQNLQNPVVSQFDNIVSNTSEPILRQYEPTVQPSIQNEEVNNNNLDIFR